MSSCSSFSASTFGRDCWTKIRNGIECSDVREKFEIIILFAVEQHSNLHQSNDFQLNENILCANVYKCLNKHSNHLDFPRKEYCSSAAVARNAIGRKSLTQFRFAGKNQKHRQRSSNGPTGGNVAQWPLENAHNSHECVCVYVWECTHDCASSFTWSYFGRANAHTSGTQSNDPKMLCTICARILFTFFIWICLHHLLNRLLLLLFFIESKRHLRLLFVCWNG